MFKRILLYAFLTLIFIGFTRPQQNTLSYQKTLDEILLLETVAWSPDGTKIAVGGGTYQCERDNLKKHAIYIIDAVTQVVLLTLEGHKCTIVNIAWSPDGNRLVSGSGDGIARVWDTSTGERLNLHSRCAGLATLTGQIWSPDGTRIADFCDPGRSVDVWDAQSGDNLFSYETNGFVDSLSWSPDGNQIAVASRNYIAESVNTIDLIDVETASSQIIYKVESGSTTAMDWSPDGSEIAFASGNKKISILNVLTGDTHSMLDEHTDFVYSLVWNPDGTYLASASFDGSIRVWDATDGQQLATMQSPTGRMNDVDWSPDGSQIVYVGVGVEGEPLQMMFASEMIEAISVNLTPPGS